jgi:hypothetical protein
LRAARHLAAALAAVVVAECLQLGQIQLRSTVVRAAMVAAVVVLRTQAARRALAEMALQLVAHTHKALHELRTDQKWVC